jgi:hypothetical protein
MKNALLKGEAAWDIGKKSILEKWDKAQGGTKAKKAMLEKLVKWGEEELNIRNWFIGKMTEKEGPT